MALTAPTFRTLFPAFGNVVTYPDDMVTMWLAFMLKLINVERWGELADMGQGLGTAHHLALEARAIKDAERGAMPGGTVGILTSKSAGGVSAGYDVNASTEKNAGFWNQTTYGTRFYRYSRMMGAGPIQVGSDPAITSVSAWSGPPYMP